MPPGSEPVWTALAGPKPFGIPVSHFQHVVFNNPNWDFLTLDFDKDVAFADRLDKGLLNANDPNLKPFFAHAGKLIIYHGWNDQLISAYNSINYHNSAAEKSGAASNPVRLHAVLPIGRADSCARLATGWRTFWVQILPPGADAHDDPIR